MDPKNNPFLKTVEELHPEEPQGQQGTKPRPLAFRPDPTPPAKPKMTGLDVFTDPVGMAFTKPQDADPQDFTETQLRKIKENELQDLSEGEPFERHPTSDVINRARAMEAGRKAQLRRQREQYSFTEEPVKRLKEEVSQRFYFGDEVEGPDMPLDIGVGDVASFLGEEAVAGGVAGSAFGPKGAAIGAAAGFSYSALKNWWKETNKSSDIYKKAHTSGFSSLTDDEREWLRNNTPREAVRRLRAETTGGHQLTPDEIRRINLEQEWYESQEKRAVEDDEVAPFYLSREVLLPPKVEYSPSAARRDAKLFEVKLGPFEAVSAAMDGKYDYKIWEEEWKRRASAIPPEAWEKQISHQDRERILGVDVELEKERQQQKETQVKLAKMEKDFATFLNEKDNEARKDRAFGIDPRTGRSRGFPRAVRDLPLLENLDMSMSVDLQALRAKLYRLILSEVGDDPEFADATPIELENEAFRRYQISENYFTKAGSGIAFYHPDLTGAVAKKKEAIERFKSGELPFGIKVDPYTMSLARVGIGGPAQIISAQDFAIPLITAFAAPRYSVHISDTHADFTSHRAMDILMGLDFSNWLGAALKTKDEEVFGYINSDGERVAGKGGIDAPQKGEDVSGDKEKRVSMRFITEKEIMDNTGSASLTAASVGGGGDKGAGFGLLQLLLNPDQTAFTEQKNVAFIEGVKELSEQIPKKTHLLVESIIDYQEIKRGFGDPETTDRYAHNIRKGNLLPLTYDSLAARYAEAIGATPEEKQALRRSAMLVGLGSLVAPGTGTDFVSPMFIPMAAGFRQTRRWAHSRAQDPKYLEKLADEELIPDQKLQKVKKRDRVLGQSIEKEVLIDMSSNKAVGTVVNGAERAAIRAEREAWALSEAAGVHSSPAVLPGGRLQDRTFRERWLDMETSNIQREAKLNGLEVNPTDALDMAKNRLSQLEAENLARIERNVAPGDVYAVGDQMYIRVLDGFYPVADESEIVMVRSNMINNSAPEAGYRAEIVYGTRTRLKNGQMVEEDYIEGLKYVEDSASKEAWYGGSPTSRVDKPRGFSDTVQFSELPARDDLFDPDVYLAWTRSRESVSLESMQGARAVNVRDPITVPTAVRQADLPVPTTGLERLEAATGPLPRTGGSDPTRTAVLVPPSAPLPVPATPKLKTPEAVQVAEKQEEALRKQLAAAELRALEARQDFERLQAGNFEEFEELQALHSLHATAKQEVTELIEQINKLDLQSAPEFKAWSELRAQTDAAAAGLARAEAKLKEAVQPMRPKTKTEAARPAGTFTDPKPQKMGVTEKLKRVKELRRRRNVRKRVYNDLAERTEEAGKPIAAKQKEFKSLNEQLIKKTAEMRVFRSSLDNSTRTWSDPFLEALETKGVKDAVPDETILKEELAALEKEALSLESQAATARKNLDDYVDTQAKDLRGSGAARESTKRESRAIAQAAKKELESVRASGRAKVLNNVLRKRARQIREGNKAISEMSHLEEAVDDLIDVTTKNIDRQVGGNRTLDAKMFVNQIEEEVGKDVVRHAMKSDSEAGKVLKQIYEAAAEGKDAVLNGLKTRSLYEFPKLLRQSWRETHQHSDSITAVEALRIAKQDPDMNYGSTLAMAPTLAGAALGSPLGTAGIVGGAVVGGVVGLRGQSQLAHVAKSIRPAFDPIRSRTGTLSGDMVDVAKYAEHATGHVRDELEALARYIDKEAIAGGWSTKKKADRLLEAYTEYLTTNRPLDFMRARSTFFNEGSESVWQQARWQMLNDPRGMGYRQLKQRGDEWAKTQRAQGVKVTDDDIYDYINTNFAADLENLNQLGGLPLRAISRSFIPEWGFSGANASQAARAYNQAYKILEETENFTQFRAAIQEMNYQVFGGKPLEVKSTQHMVYALTHAAIQHRANLMAARLTGFIDPKGVRDTANFFSGNLHKVENFDAMLDTMNRMGLPFTESYIQRATGAGILGTEGSKASKELIATGIDKGGQTFFMPQTLAKTIDDAMPAVTKELEQTYRRAKTPVELMRILPDRDYNRLWKTSVVTGLFVPRPKYFWNNFIGDWGQIWFEHGFGTSAGVSAQLVGRETFNFLSHKVPGAKHLRKFHGEMMKKYGAENTLGSTWNAFMNPHANKIWRGEEGVLRTRYGAEYKYSEVRKMLEQEKILDTMVHEELLATFDRYVPDSWTKTPWLAKSASILDDQRYNISWLAMHVQQRQRGNMFMELLRQGYKPREAGRLAVNALYDWKHAMTRWETLTIGKLSPFYRFWRLGFGQTARRFMEPLTLPPQEAVERAMMGRSAPSRLRQKYAALESIPHLGDPELAHEHMTEQEAYDHAAKYYRPSWAQKKFLTYINPADTYTQDHYWRSRGQGITHTFGIMPPDTTIDTLEIGTSIMMGLSGAALSMIDPDWNIANGPDLTAMYFTRPTLDLLAPTVSAPIESMMKERGIDTGSYKYGNYTRINAFEKAFLDKSAQPYAIGAMSATGALAGAGKSNLISGKGLGGAIAGAGLGYWLTSNEAQTNANQVMVAERSRIMALRMMPFFGQELGNVFNLYGENPYARALERLDYETPDEKSKLIKESMLFGFKTYMGQNTYGFNPQTTIDYRKKSIIKAAEAEIEKRMEELEPKTPTDKRTLD